MNLSILVKKFKANLLFRVGIPQKRLIDKARTGFFILMYHRIIDPGTCPDYLQPGMYVTPKTFTMHLDALSEWTTIVPLDDLLNFMAKREFPDTQKPFGAITFDDGWVDFYSNAFPLLKKHNIPATVFIPTNFIGTNRQFWTDRLAAIWKKRIPGIVERTDQLVTDLTALKGTFENQIEKAIEILKQKPLKTIEQTLDKLQESFRLKDCTAGERFFLDWEEIETMRMSSPVSFGSHTANHHLLTTIDNDAIRRELAESRKQLLDKNICSIDTIPFCYPNGNHNTAIAGMVEMAGYSCAVTTKNGWNNFSENLFNLKRIGVHQDMTSTVPMFFRLLSR